MRDRNPPRGREGAERAWSLKDICELIDVLIEREITEFELEKGGVKIRIKRGDAHAGSSAPAGRTTSSPPTASPHTPPPAVAPTPPSSPTSAPVEPSATESAEELYIIKSPIVGTFYAAPAPNAPPFVNLGDGVQVGQVLCIIEAMKLMNEIESEVAGEIVRVYVENGQPVEYGQSLFAIKPSHKR